MNGVTMTVLSKRIERKGVTDFAGFIAYNGFFYRLDWELALSADLPDSHVRDLMLAQIQADLADEEHMKEISTRPFTLEAHDALVTKWLDAGYTLRKDLSDRT